MDGAKPVLVIHRRNGGAHPTCERLAHVSKEHGQALWSSPRAKPWSQSNARQRWCGVGSGGGAEPQPDPGSRGGKSPGQMRRKLPIRGGFKQFLGTKNISGYSLSPGICHKPLPFASFRENRGPETPASCRVGASRMRRICAASSGGAVHHGWTIAGVSRRRPGRARSRWSALPAVGRASARSVPSARHALCPYPGSARATGRDALR